jgi:hypothetical protein
VLVHAEDLAHDQHHRQVVLARRHRAVGRHLEVADVDRYLAHRQARAVGLDLRLRFDRQHGRRKSRADAGARKVAAGEGS